MSLILFITVKKMPNISNLREDRFIFLPVSEILAYYGQDRVGWGGGNEHRVLGEVTVSPGVCSLGVLASHPLVP